MNQDKRSVCVCERQRESRDENSLVSAIYICGESINLRPEHEPSSFSSLMRSMNTDPATSLNATPMRTNSSRFFAEKKKKGSKVSIEGGRKQIR